MDDATRDKFRKIVTKGDDNLEVAAGSTPKGTYKFVRMGAKEEEFNSNQWVPVVFKCTAGEAKGLEVTFSLAVLCKSRDLQYRCGRNVGKRSDWWCAQTAANNIVIEFLGKEGNNEFTARRDMTLNGVKFSEGEDVPAGTFKVSRFKHQVLG